jgi:hypothetical protein
MTTCRVGRVDRFASAYLRRIVSIGGAGVALGSLENRESRRSASNEDEDGEDA